MTTRSKFPVEKQVKDVPDSNRESVEVISKEVQQEINRQNLKLRETWLDAISRPFFVALILAFFLLGSVVVLISAALELYKILNTNVWTTLATNLIVFIIARISTFSNNTKEK